MPSSLDHSRRTKFFDSLFHAYSGTPFAVRSADGWNWSSHKDAAPEATLIFNSAAAWHALMTDPTERTLGEAFIDGHLDLEGNIFSVFPIARYVVDRPASARYNILRTIWRASADVGRVLHRGTVHSKARDRAAISYHYDLPVDFYRPWLGSTLAYSCAYFRDPMEGLDCAQTNKLELICRKLNLQPEDRFLDIGCGWGSLVLHAASQHSAMAHGITLSKEQAAVATGRVSHARLQDRCTVELRDYRDMPSLPVKFDKIASVGMFEHVGMKKLREYFSIALQMLSPNGAFLNHGIARSTTAPPARDSFIDKYVFPDGELVPLGQVLEIAENVGFEVRDVDNLRFHYERTLRLWVENLQANARTVLQHASERTYRIWLLYMAGSADAFRIGRLELYQVLLGPRPGLLAGNLTTREHWYDSWTTEASKATVA